MKKQTKKTISLKKLTIAIISDNVMRQVQGGDCLPTEHESDWYCNDSYVP
ncbi:hypothetical protein [Aquimarina rubra]|uniref:Natural product n=1 Tax=Aquimarina rubra TaxID=1920033 RepID=A0ABW5LFY1_9FLAO